MERLILYSFFGTLLLRDCCAVSQKTVKRYVRRRDFFLPRTEANARKDVAMSSLAAIPLNVYYIPLPLYNDNNGAISMAKSEVLHSCSKNPSEAALNFRKSERKAGRT